MNPKVGKDVAFLTVSKILTTMIALVSAMLLSRFRSLEEYGTYSQIITVITLATSIFMLGLPNSTNYFLARAGDAEERGHFLSVYYTLSTLLSIIMGIVLAVGMPALVSYFENPVLKSFAYVLALLPLTKVIIGSLSNVLVVYGKTQLLLLNNILNTAVSLVAILLVQVFGWSFHEYMLLYLAGETVIAVWVYMIVFRLEQSVRFALDKGLIARIFAYSIPIGLAGFVGTINLEIGKLIIGRFFSTEMLAIYANAAKELPLTIVSASFTAVLLPQIAKLLKEKRVKETVDLWGYSVEISFLFICFFTMGCIVFAPQMISILYSDKYLPGVGLFRIYSLVMLLRMTYFGIVLSSAGKTKLILYCSIASMLINVVLTYLLYHLLGFVGPAVAALLSMLIMSVYQLYRTKDFLGVTMKQIFPWRNLAKIAGVNIVFGIVLYIVSLILHLNTSSTGNMVSVLIGLAAAGVYAILYRKKAIALWRRLNGG